MHHALITILLAAVICIVPRVAAEEYRPEQINGWTVHLSERLASAESERTATALALLSTQLAEIARLVPPRALARLREVPLWFSLPYPGTIPKAEYHPNVDWLREHGRNPAMAKSVEFTNVRIYEQETRRMPVFVLHELAHAYHDRVLGFEEPRIKAAFEKARAGGKYDRVERQDAEGRKSIDRAYAITNHREYFAEGTEAFFGRNDFFPYDRDELKKHDPELFALLEMLWQGPAAPVTTIPAK